MVFHILLGNWFITFWTESEKPQAMGLVEGEIGSSDISFTTEHVNGRERRVNEPVWCVGPGQQPSPQPAAHSSHPTTHTQGDSGWENRKNRSEKISR